MARPTDPEIQAARTALNNAKLAAQNDERQIEQYRDEIKVLRQNINDLNEDLPNKQLVQEQAQANARKLLADLEEAVDLKIKASDLSVLQGGRARFEAEYDRPPPLPPNVQLTWDTGGCSITRGDEHSRQIEVDTSSVQPGDYGISVFLTLV